MGEEQTKSESKVLPGAARFVADSALIPGTSQLINGQVKSGLLHAVAGLAARAVIGPIGWLAVAANSTLTSTTGAGVFGQSKKKQNVTTTSPTTTSPPVDMNEALD